jgi:hypothetical protein
MTASAKPFFGASLLSTPHPAEPEEDSTAPHVCVTTAHASTHIMRLDSGEAPQIESNVARGRSVGRFESA